MKISLIVAVDKNRGIGKNGKMPWDIPADLKRFKEITMGHPIIMGRKTYDSIGRLLPERYNVVITRDQEFKINNLRKGENFAVVSSLNEALQLVSVAQGNDECFIIGGGQIFNEAINISDKLYLTLVEGEYDVDTYFPEYSMFKNKVYEEIGESNGFKYKFINLEK
jgi:dihydrofolate reductase